MIIFKVWQETDDVDTNMAMWKNNRESKSTGK